MGSRSQTAIMVRLLPLLLLVSGGCWGSRQRRESSTFLLRQMPHQFTALKRFVNFGKPTLRPWQQVTPLPSRLAPTFQAAAVSSSPVVAQQALPSLRLPSELSISSSINRAKQQQQARLVQAPRQLDAGKKGEQVEVNLLEDGRFDLLSNGVELLVRLHPEEEMASRG